MICGSLAFDTIMDFEGRFAEQILPDQLHILNVSFLVPALRRDFGGCAGNIAYSLHQLGGQAYPVAALGNDGGVGRVQGFRAWWASRAERSAIKKAARSSRAAFVWVKTAYLAAVLYLLRNFSTRPPMVSTDFWVPV